MSDIVHGILVLRVLSKSIKCKFYIFHLFIVLGCPIGHYGENCSIRCPQNCREGHCDIVEGTCLGCSPGYKKSKCNKGKLFRFNKIAAMLTYNQIQLFFHDSVVYK